MRNILGFYFLDITLWNFTEVGIIRFLSELVIIRRENTFHVILFHCKAKTANTTKQIYSFIFLL